MSLTADPRPVTFETVRAVALGFPGVEEGTAYGTPAFRARKPFLARLHGDGEALVLRVNPARHASLAEADPVTFSVTDHLQAHPYVLVRLATVGHAELEMLFGAAWRERAPRTLVRSFDAGPPS